MIRTDFLAGQGLGNQLWVYAACRAIAENLQRPYLIGGMEKFKGRGFLEIDQGDFYENAVKASEGSIEAYEVFREKLFYDSELKYLASDYDCRVEKINKLTFLEGLFQSESYLYGRESSLGGWIRLTESLRVSSRQYSDICVINLRGGEYKRHKNLILPASYWTNAIQNIKNERGIEEFLVVTDDRDYAKVLFPNLPILEGGIAECYSALYGANCLIVSNSSFSYFPIKTRLDKPYVIAPYHWSRFSNKFSRWASPANLYKDWIWQSVEGRLHSYDECIHAAERTRDFYSNWYNVSVPADAIRVAGIFQRLPDSLKRPIKLVLSRFFPGKIG